MSWIASVESSFESLRMALGTKIERDIRVTLGARDYVTRQLANQADYLADIFKESRQPLLSLPRRAQELARSGTKIGLMVSRGDFIFGNSFSQRNLLTTQQASTPQWSRDFFHL